MNILVFELKSELKSALIWTVSLVGALLIFMSGVFPIFQESMEDVIAIMQNFPPEFAAAFGISLESMTGYLGFYNFSYGYLALIGAIMATSVTLSVFAREKKARCNDFLLAKPISRQSIFLYKLAAVAIIILGANIVYTAVSLWLYNHYEGGNIMDFIIGSSGVFLTQWVFVALGVLYANFVKRVRSIAGIATAFGFGAFIISALYGILDEEIILFVAPLKYFEPRAYFFADGFELKLVVTAVLIVAIGLLVSALRFKNRDISSV